jgi:cyclohexanone monooxygenase
VVEPSEAAETEWVRTVVDSAVMRAKFAEECTPGYYNNEGKPSVLAARNGPFGRGPIQFVKILENWRADGGLPGLELSAP